MLEWNSYYSGDSTLVEILISYNTTFDISNMLIDLELSCWPRINRSHQVVLARQLFY